MGTKKLYITLIVIIFIFFIVMFLLFGLDNLKDKGNVTTIIVGDTTFVYRNQKWSTPSGYEDLNWKKYTVYIDNSKKGNYYLVHSDKWYLFDDNKNAIDLSGNMVAYDTNRNITIYDFKEEEIDDYTYVNKVLSDNNISDSKYTASYKIPIDFDNDGVVENFYIISNVFAMDFVPSKTFSIVFMEKNGEIYNIYEDILKGSSFDGCKPYIKTFIDVNDDNKSEFVLSCAGYSVSDNSDTLYEYKDNEFKIVISN